MPSKPRAAGGDAGAQLALGLDPRVAIGTHEEIAANPASYTGQYLKQAMHRRGAKPKRTPQAAHEERGEGPTYSR